jgi:hypothetical protein
MPKMITDVQMRKSHNSIEAQISIYSQLSQENITLLIDILIFTILFARIVPFLYNRGYLTSNIL